MDDEIRFHLETRAALFMQRGYTREAAMAEARRRFGARDDTELEHKRRALAASAAYREDRMRLRDRLDTLWQDLRYAVRGIRRAPGFAAAVIVTLALGIGANTAIFSVVRAVLLRPLPYPAADRLVVVWNHWTNWPRTWLSQPEVADYAAQRTVFERFAAFTNGAMNVTGVSSHPERVAVGLVEASIFDVTGVRPLLGRTFTTPEDTPHGPRAVMLLEDFWQRRYAGDRALLGKMIQLDGQPYTVVGIVPRDFRLPLEFAGDHAQALVPLQLGPPDENQRGSHGYNAVAKLAPGVSLAQAQRRTDAFIARLKAEHPNNYGPEFGVLLVTAGDQVRGDVKAVLLVLLGAVSFVLLIGCANIANLLLARAESRGREIAVRTALGAGRARLTLQLLTESVVLALVGGALGLVIATWAVRSVGATNLANVPRLDEVTIDGGVLVYTLAVSLLTGVLFGLAPVVHTVRGEVHDLLRQGRGNTAGRSRTRLRQLLVAVELALAVVAVTGAVLMTRSFARLIAVSPGFSAEHVLTFQLSPPAARYATSSSVRAFYAGLLEQVRALPGVRQAGAIMGLPLSGTIGDWDFQIEGVAPPPRGSPAPAADWEAVTAGYFEAMRIPVLRGRGIAETDRLGAQPVVVISEATAKQYFPTVGPLGRRIMLGGRADSVWRTIVGVVGDVKHGGLDKDARTTLYVPHDQFTATLPDSAGAVPRSLSVVVRTAGDPAMATASIRGVVRQLDPDVPLARVRTLDDVLAASVSTPRLATYLLLAFGVLAVLLSAVGVYGVMSYVVAQRTSEIGIRVALGARAGDVLRLIMWQGMRPVLVGLVSGLVLAYGGTRLMQGFLFRVSATDPPSLAGAVLVLAAIAALGNWRPARRAAGVDPIAALRTE
jgi:predicted permease